MAFHRVEQADAVRRIHAQYPRNRCR
jgi:hypothetical protein